MESTWLLLVLLLIIVIDFHYKLQNIISHKTRFSSRERVVTYFWEVLYITHIHEQRLHTNRGGIVINKFINKYCFYY